MKKLLAMLTPWNAPRRATAVNSIPPGPASVGAQPGEALAEITKERDALRENVATAIALLPPVMNEGTPDLLSRLNLAIHSHESTRKNYENLREKLIESFGLSLGSGGNVPDREIISWAERHAPKLRDVLFGEGSAANSRFENGIASDRATAMNANERRAVFSARVQELQGSGMSYDDAFANAKSDPRYGHLLQSPGEAVSVAREKEERGGGAAARAAAISTAVNNFMTHHACDYETAWNAVRADQNMRPLFDAMHQPECAR